MTSGDWTVGALLSGQTETLTIPVEAKAGTVGCIVNTATATFVPDDPVADQDLTKNTATVAIGTPPGCADLELRVTVTDTIDPVEFRPVIFINYFVTNLGPMDADNVVLSTRGPQIEGGEITSNTFTVVPIGTACGILLSGCHTATLAVGETLRVRRTLLL